MIRRHPRLFAALAGSGGGFLCGLLGSGGGIVTLLLFRILFPDWEERALLLSVAAVIFPAVTVAAVFYLAKGMLPLTKELFLLAPAAALGGLVGCRLSAKLKGKTLRLLFGGMLLLGGGILLCR